VLHLLISGVFSWHFLSNSLLISLVFIGEISSESEIKRQTFHNQVFLDVLSCQNPMREKKNTKMPFWHAKLGDVL
jgi:hypothetical protein